MGMDKAEAIRVINAHIRRHHIGQYPHIKIAKALNLAISALEQDSVPVVHGFNTYDHNSAFRCSICDFSDWDTLTADSGKYNYCPNCGARMDGAKHG